MNIHPPVRKMFFLTTLCLSLGFSAACANARDWERLQGRNSNNTAMAANTGGTVYGGRSYILRTPTQSKGKMPLLIVLHGGMGNAPYMESKSGMDGVVNRYGMMVAYLNGTEGRIRAMKDKRTWNAGGCCGIAQRENIDDVRYIDGFIRHMVETRNADPSRIYLMGHSNGVMMSYRFACQNPGVVSAIVTVSGPLMINNCPSARGLRVLHIQGEQDAHVPVAGGRGERTMTDDTVFRSVEETKKIMTAAGANMTVELIPGVDHNLGKIGNAINLPEKAAKFLLNK